MRLRLLAAGTRLERWVDLAFEDYAARLAHELPLELFENELGRRGKSVPVSRAVEEEGKRMLARILPGDYVVALEVTGRAHTTEALAQWLGRRQADGRDVVFLIGGPDGLAAQCLARANESLSLSPLTLPHALARVVLAEQVYRVLSLARGHPYHRA